MGVMGTKFSSFFDKHLWLIIGVGSILMVLVAVEPFGADNAVLHSMALDLVAHGRVPYIGSWDNNFPGIIYIHALSIVFFGSSPTAYRIFDIIIELAFAVFFYRFLLRWLTKECAALAAILYCAYYVSASVDLYGKQDAYGMMAVLIGISFLIGKDGNVTKRIDRTVIAGVLSGVSLLMRPTFLLYIGLTFLYIAWPQHKKFSIHTILLGLVFTISSLIPSICVVGYYASIPSGLQSLYNSVIRFNLDLYAGIGTDSKLWWELARSGFTIPLALYALLGNTGRGVKKVTLKNIALYVGFLFGAIGIVIMMGKYYRYHLAPFYMLITPLTAIGIEKVLQNIQLKKFRLALQVGIIFFCSFIAYNPKAPLAFAKGLWNHSDPFLGAIDARRADPRFGAKTERAVIRYLNSHSSGDGTIEICGFDPFLRFDLQSERTIVGPYTTFHALAFRTDGTRRGTPHYTNYQKKWQLSYVQTLQTTKPQFIILDRYMPFWYIRDVYDDCLHYLPGFDSLTGNDYHLDTMIGGYQIFRRVQ